MNPPSISSVDVLIYVALTEEFEAVMGEVGDRFNGTEMEDKNFIFYTGEIESPILGRNTLVAIASAGRMGNTRSASITSILVDKLRPKNVVVLGIAGSTTSDLQPGDVFIPSSITEYLANSAAIGEDRSWTLEVSSIEYPTAPRLLNRFQNFAFTDREHYGRWLAETEKHASLLIDSSTRESLKRAGINVPKKSALVVGDDRKLASGPAVGKGKAFLDWLKHQVDRKIAAIEMESAGVHDAVSFQSSGPRAIAIRGISDFADERKEKIEDAAKTAFRALAIKNALVLVLRSIEAGIFRDELIHGTAPAALAQELPTSFRAMELTGARKIQINVSQLFRTLNIYKDPSSCRATRIHSVFSKSDAFRRLLTTGSPIRVGTHGYLKPIVTSKDEFDQFWSIAANYTKNNSLPIYFIPFELVLNNQSALTNLRYDLDSIIELDSGASLASVENQQTSVGVRIYPHGIGLIRLSITITFPDRIDLALVTLISKKIEELYFVDATKRSRPCASLFVEMVENTLSSLFARRGPTAADVCWRPPTTTFIINESEPNQTSPNERFFAKLSLLMQGAPGNFEDSNVLAQRVHQIWHASHWNESKVLAIPGISAAIFYLGNSSASGIGKTIKKYQYWLREAYELLRVAGYCLEAFDSELNEISGLKLLDSDWLPNSASENFDMLSRLIAEMREAKRATFLIEAHLNKHGAGFLKNFAHDAWSYCYSPDTTQSSLNLQYLHRWYSGRLTQEMRGAIEGLLKQIDDILGIPSPFK